jgi:hypothetical protein
MTKQNAEHIGNRVLPNEKFQVNGKNCLEGDHHEEDKRIIENNGVKFFLFKRFRIWKKTVENFQSAHCHVFTNFRIGFNSGCIKTVLGRNLKEQPVRTAYIKD